MSKRKQSKLTDHTGQLDEWFGEEGLTLAAVRERLAQASCSVSLARLSEWRVNRDWERRRAQLLNQIAAGARHCGQLEEQFGKNPPRELETLIRLHRVIILQLSAQMNSNPDAFRWVTTVMKTMMDDVKRDYVAAKLTEVGAGQEPGVRSSASLSAFEGEGRGEVAPSIRSPRHSTLGKEK